MAKDSGNNNTEALSDIYMNILYRKPDSTDLLWFRATVGYIDTSNHKFINIIGTSSSIMKPLCKYVNQNYFGTPSGSMTNVSNNHGIGDFFKNTNIFELQLYGQFNNIQTNTNTYFSDFINNFGGENAFFIVKFRSRLVHTPSNTYTEHDWPACLKLNKSQLLGLTGVYDNITADPSQNVTYESSYQGYVWEPYFAGNL